jgi:hypothetical protein
MVFENRVLRVIFVAKSDKITGEWNNICFECLRDMWSSPKMENQIKKIEMGGAYSACGRAAYEVMMVWGS